MNILIHDLFNYCMCLLIVYWCLILVIFCFPCQTSSLVWLLCFKGIKPSSHSYFHCGRQYLLYLPDYAGESHLSPHSSKYLFCVVRFLPEGNFHLLCLFVWTCFSEEINFHMDSGDCGVCHPYLSKLKILLHIMQELQKK